MKRTLGTLALGMVALCATCAGAGPIPKTPGHKETITVEGKLPLDLRGAWLLVAYPEVSAGKFKSFPQLLKVSANKDGGLVLHLLDVQLPRQIDQGVKDANRSLTAWTPSPKDLDTLRKQWSTLPRPTKREPGTGHGAYAEVGFTLATPEHYGELFPTRDDKLDAVLGETVFSLQIEERYQPEPQRPGSNVSQLALRKTIYGVRRNAGDALIEGRQVVGWIAAGPGVPIPINFSGPFRMYRLASADRKDG